MVMTLFHDYSQFGELLQTREEILGPANFPRYLKQYGFVQAKAYHDTLRDIIACIKPLLAFDERYEGDDNFRSWRHDHRSKVNRTTEPFSRGLKEALKITETRREQDLIEEPLATYAKEHLTGVRDALWDAVDTFDNSIIKNPVTGCFRNETYWELNEYRDNQKAFLRFIKPYFKKYQIGSNDYTNLNS